MGKFVIKRTADDGYMFNLKATNGEVIATSEVYNSRAACENGINSVIENAAVAPVEDQTVADYTEEKNPKFELYTDKAGEFRFRLKAPNGKIVAVSEGYTQKVNCKNGIDSIRKNIVGATVEVLD